MNGEPLLKVRALRKTYKQGKHVTCAVSGVDLDIYPGEVLGLVGESGSGKSTLARCILRLEEPTSGSVEFAGHDLLRLSRKGLKALRKEMQIVFQNPYTSLNPRMTVEEVVGEGLAIHRLARGQKRRQAVHELLRLVGLPKHLIHRYPHEFSGGQRQRIGIARALASSPSLLICDEPISALDLSIQAQVVNLLLSLQREMGLTYLFIAHDLSMIRFISNRVGVMYRGELVEIGDTHQVFNDPQHPYTKKLLAANPIPDPKKERARRAKIKLAACPSTS